MTSAVVLLLSVAGCGGADDGTVDAEDAGMGPDAGFDVLVDTAATPAGGATGGIDTDTVLVDTTLGPPR